MRTIAQTIERRGEKIGMQKGIQEKAIAIAKSRLKEGCEVSFIEKVTNLSKQTIEKLKKANITWLFLPKLVGNL